MNDFQTINDIVNESIRNSSYYTVAISSGVFILYTLIIQLIGYFKQKNKNKPIMEMSKALQEMTVNIVKLNSVLDKTFKEADRKREHQCSLAIDLSFKSFAYKINQDVVSVIVHNNIDKNRALITSNINKLISTEYYKLRSILSSYEFNDVNIASKLKETWIKEVTDAVVSIIYNKQDATTRITQVTNKINLLVNEYSTYINNKVFNT